MARAVKIFFWCAALLATRVYAQQAEPEGEAAPAGELTKPPKLVHFVEATFPQKATATSASVILVIDIGADGKVENAEVTESPGDEFSQAALAAVRQFVFEPGEVDRKPAPVRITYKYDFVIKSETVSLGPQVNFEGVVLERFSKKPLAGVTVRITDTALNTVTDAEGRFAFKDVPLGTHKVELSGPTLITVATEEEIVKGIKKTVKYRAEEKQEGVDEEVVVRAPRIKKESVQTIIRTEEARRVPGTQGDTLKVVQNLPGVARSAVGSGALIVWGAAPKETRVNLDGVEIPALYHIGGLRSTVNSDLVKSIDLLPGAYGAEFGRGLGGLVRIETRALPPTGVHGYVAADVMDASAMLSATIGKRLRLAVSGRYSYLDRVLGKVVSPDVGDFFPIPRYDDYQLKATLDLRRDETLSALFVASDDHLRRAIGSSDPAQVRSEETDNSFYRFILRYQRLFEDGASFSITPSIGFDTARAASKFGANPTSLETRSWRYALRASYRRKLHPIVTLSFGGDVQSAPTAVARTGSYNLPPREGDPFVFGQPPSDDISSDRWSAQITDVAAYAYTELNLNPVVITPGVRVDAFLIDVSRLTPKVGAAPAIGSSTPAWAADPRLTISYTPLKRLTFTASGGIYHQAPEPDELSAVFGNPTLTLSRALHASLGGAVKLTGTLSLEAVGFYKMLDNLVSRSALTTPPLARALTQDGTGTSYGGQALLRQALFKNFFGWVSYSISRSERRDHPGQAARLFDYDQTHVLSVVASYEFYGWTLGARFRYTTGVPRTPVAGAFYDARDDLYQPILGQRNTTRLPDFYQLDLRLEKAFSFGGTALTVFLDVQNVTNRKNAEEMIYNFDYSKRSYISGMPTLAVLGARFQF